MKRLQIGIDSNEANVEKRVGTGQYAYNLLKEWYTRKDVDFHLYHRDPLQSDMPKANDYWHYYHVGPRPGWLRVGLPFKLLLDGHRNDVFWSPAHYTPQYVGSNSVVTIHDLAYEYFPELFLPSDLYKLKNWTSRAVTKATRVIAVSEATKRDIMKFYGVEQNKISVVLNGYDAHLFNTTQKANIKMLANLNISPYNYLLFVGTIQPRKNVIKLVQAFELLKQQGYGGKLVLAGKAGWMADETLQYTKNSPQVKDILLPGYVSDEMRKALYTYCDTYILPSLYEGFGVPVLEAMACGAPVAVANNSSLPEVVGNAGVLFDPTDPVDIARAIGKLKIDRDAWVERSLAHATQFSWEQCAKETLDILVNTI